VYENGAKVTFMAENSKLTGYVVHVLRAGEKPLESLSSLDAKVLIPGIERRFDEKIAPLQEESFFVRTKKTKTVPAGLYWLSREEFCGVRTLVRQYGLLAPLNWGDDCIEHMFLQNRFWNVLVEIERDNRDKYRAIVGSDEQVAAIQGEVDGLLARIAEIQEQRTQLRIRYRKKNGIHTEPLDASIKALKAQLKELARKAKAVRDEARVRIRGAGPELKNLEEERRQLVKDGYNGSGLWWGNYNAVIDSYSTARRRAMKEGAELRFHRFDGSGRFTCQIMGGMSIEELTSGRHSVAQVRKVSGGQFTDLIRSAPALQLQAIGSRRHTREYGVLRVTVYTGRDEEGKKTRRALDFPIILHRPLPEGVALKTLSINRKKVGTDYRWSVTFTFSIETSQLQERRRDRSCGINLGWKMVEGGLRVATINDGKETRHLVLPQVILDKLAYAEKLQGRIDLATNANYAWLLGKMENPPEPLKDDVAALRRAKRPHPAKFARFVIKWRNEYPGFAPQSLREAEAMRKSVKRLSQEQHHLRDKVQRRRLEFYRNEAKKIAQQYGVIRLDKMDLRQMTLLEKGDGMPNDLTDVARYHRKTAALSEFREWLHKQALKEGGRVEMVAMQSTRICSACGRTMEPAAGLMWRCRCCGALMDRDENAAANLQRAFG